MAALEGMREGAGNNVDQGVLRHLHNGVSCIGSDLGISIDTDGRRLGGGIYEHPCVSQWTW